MRIAARALATAALVGVLAALASWAVHDAPATAQVGPRLSGGPVGKLPCSTSARDGLWCQRASRGMQASTATGALTITATDAATTTRTTAATLRHETSGTAAAGYGTALELYGEDAGGTMESMCTVDARWTDAAASSEDADLVVSCRAAGAAAAEVWRVTGTGQVGIGGAPDAGNELHVRAGTAAANVIAETTGATASAQVASRSDAATASLSQYGSTAAGNLVTGVAFAGLALVNVGAGASGLAIAADGDPVIVATNGAERVRWNTSGDQVHSTTAVLEADGDLGLGHQSPVGKLHVAAADGSAAAYVQRSAAAAGDDPALVVRRSRGTVAAPTATVAADALGGLTWQGRTDGWQSAASLRCTAAAGWGATGADAPGECTISTSADGSATPTARMQWTSTGDVVVSAGTVATGATAGFLRASMCAGTPTGAAVDGSIVVDTANHKLYFRSGGVWRDAGP